MIGNLPMERGVPSLNRKDLDGESFVMLQELKVRATVINRYTEISFFVIIIYYRC